ncbi:MAG: class A beta-lactamase-related serine hydrolase [Caldilinea sp. CFX5]|nr:class A beta-lactamase-related serine hydrolase [Caldilinea sp. CFX5]
MMLIWHKYIIHSGVLLLITAALSLTVGHTPQVQGAALSQPADDADFAAIDAYLVEQMAELRIPGLALGIVQGDQVVYRKGFGIADPTGRAVTPQTPFVLNSISKSFVALAVMQLVEQGRIELDAPVQRYLPWFQVADATAASRITVRHLLNHTSGLPASAAYPELVRPATATDSLEERVRRLRTIPLNRPVGTTFEYTDANYDLLGLLVQTVAGQPYPLYVQQQILTPLAMTHSATTQPAALPPDLATGYRSWFGWPVPFRQWYIHAMLPSGDLIATAEDITHYLIAQLNEGRYGEQQVLSPQGIATLHEPAVSEGRGDRFYGMGWISRSLNGIPVVRHDGTSANYYADVVLDPAGEWGVVLLLNFNSFHLYGGRIQALSGGIVSLLHEQSPPTLSAMHHPLLYPLLLIVLIGTGLLLLWLARSFWLWRRWQRNVIQHPQGWRRWVALGAPVALPLLWALLLLVLVPQLTYPLAVLRINIPDLGYTLLGCGVILGLWCCLWVGINWFGGRRRVNTVNTVDHTATPVNV